MIFLIRKVEAGYGTQVENQNFKSEGRLSNFYDFGIFRDFCRGFSSDYVAGEKPSSCD